MMTSLNPAMPNDCDPALTEPETTIARSHTYNLFAQLFADGLDANLAHHIEQIPELQHHTPYPADPDRQAAEFQTIFGLDVFPHESVFLTTDGLLGGVITQQLADIYGRAGYPYELQSHTPDHISVQLGFLAWLCAQESTAHDAGDRGRIDTWRATQFAFLDGHLWRWLLPFGDAVAALEVPFYTALIDLTRELAADHLSGLPAAERVDFALPTISLPLDAAETTMKDIADHLVRPARCGFFISRAELRRLGRALELPAGFGDRQQTLLNLMRAAITFERFSHLIGLLRSLAEERRRRYAGHAGDFPELATYAATWRAQIGKTIELLDTVDRLAKDELELIGFGQ